MPGRGGPHVLDLPEGLGPRRVAPDGMGTTGDRHSREPRLADRDVVVPGALSSGGAREGVNMSAAARIGMGVAAGYLYWQYGLEAAMLAHFTGDIVLHIIGDSIALRVRAASAVARR